MRLIPRVFTALALFMLVISYQNFTSTDSSTWDSANTLKIIHEMQDFEKNDTRPQETFATPTNGSDLQSVGSNWAQRQSSLLLNGYDKKLESQVNDKLNSWVREITKEEAREESTVSSTEKSTNNQAEAAASSPKRPKQNLRFARVNSLKYDLGANSCLDMTADPGNTRFNYSQSLTTKAKVGVEHRTADSQTQMFLKYEW